MAAYAVAIAIAVAAAKWVPNPFHDNAVAIAIDTPSSVNTPPWIPHNPFMMPKYLFAVAVAVAVTQYERALRVHSHLRFIRRELIVE